MTADSMAALLMLAAATVWTPGPNNVLVASSGAVFGMRRTWPHVLGIALGFPLMLCLVGMFLGEAFRTSPLLREGLRWFGASILLWIAWRIGTSGGLKSQTNEPRPFTFLEAAGFQWINPKAWAMSVAVSAQFIDPDALLRSVLVVVCVFALLGLASASTWAFAGKAITRWINTDARIAWFNMTMAATIVACVALLFVD